jgi:hypothetical protein
MEETMAKKSVAKRAWKDNPAVAEALAEDKGTELTN